MFEKESKEYANNWLNHVKDLELQHKTDEKPEYIRILEAHQKGAEFGYQKGFEFGVKSNEKVNQIMTNEWHNVWEKLPPSGETVLLYYGTDVMGKIIVGTGCIDCLGTWYKNIDDIPIKWQSINLPKESE